MEASLSGPRTLKHTRGALAAGADVWFVPAKSFWTSQIDWHLNFQFSRVQQLRTGRKKNKHSQTSSLKNFSFKNSSLKHPTFRNSSLSETPLAKATENPVGNLAEAKKTSARMAVSVVSDKVFPAQQVIQLPPLQTQQWVAKLYDIWQSLGQPRARVFLPPEIKSHAFKQHLANCPGATSYADTHLIDLIEES